MPPLTLSCVTYQCPKLTQELHFSTYHIAMYVCMFSPFLLSPAPPLQHNPESAMLAVHKMELRLWPDATSIHLVGFDRIYKVTAVCHLAKSTYIVAIMVNIRYCWSPRIQGYRYCCHHGKYLLLPITAHHSLSIAAIHGKYLGSIFAIITVFQWFFYHWTSSCCSSQHLHSLWRGVWQYKASSKMTISQIG